MFNDGLELPRYSRRVPVDEIEVNDYNLNIPRYIDSSDPEDQHDLDAHLRGGIPQCDVDDLQPYWGVFPTLREVLFAPGKRPGYLAARIEPRELKATIQASTDFEGYASKSGGIWWKIAHTPGLYAFRRANPRDYSCPG